MLKLDISEKKHAGLAVQWQIHTRTVRISSIGSIGSAVLYGICSTSMAFTNKAVVSSFNFDFPFFIMACQMSICIVFIELLRAFSIIAVKAYSLKLGKLFAWPSLFYALHSVTALHALGGMSIPMYAAVKRCAPIITLILSVVVLKKRTPSLQIIISVVSISVGCILASFGDLAFDSRAYGYGAFSVLVQGLYLTLAQKCMENTSALDVLYISSYNTVVFFLLSSFLLEMKDILHSEVFSSITFLSCFGLQTCMGVLLNYSLFLCTEKNSALTTTLIGVLKSILQTVIGFFTFGGVALNALNIFGISLNMLGGIIYSYAKYKEKSIVNPVSDVKSII